MFFEEHEKRIYRPPNSEKLYDPIRVDRLLMATTKGRLDELISWRNAPYDNLGDVGAKNTNVENSALAELELAKAARVAFELPDFPDCTDGEALEYLYDFMEWMQGKGERAERQQESSPTSQEPPCPLSPMKISSDSISVLSIAGQRVS